MEEGGRKRGETWREREIGRRSRRKRGRWKMERKWRMVNEGGREEKEKKKKWRIKKSWERRGSGGRGKRKDRRMVKGRRELR